LRWVHRFSRPYPVSYPLELDDRIKNYLIGHTELRLDISPIFEHFVNYVSREHLISLARESLGAGSYDRYFRPS
jgi:hypothetical protein